MKSLCLGTASWGWSVDEKSAFSLMDYFYTQGGRYVDTANNYPINERNPDFQKSPLILASWCKSRNVTDLKLFFKAGSITNIRTPNNDLSLANLQTQLDWARERFESNLYCFMLHWDNRSDERSIEHTCEILAILRDHQIEFGLSGIRYPAIYKKVLSNTDRTKPHVQVKHNFLESDLDNYSALDCLSPRYWAYGISAGGLKIKEDQYRSDSYAVLTGKVNHHAEAISEEFRMALVRSIEMNKGIDNLYHLAISNCELNDQLAGYLIAPSRLQQLKDIFYFRSTIDFGQVDLSHISGSQN